MPVSLKPHFLMYFFMKRFQCIIAVLMNGRVMLNGVIIMSLWMLSRRQVMWNKFKDSQPIDFEKIYIKHNQEVIERYYIGRRYGFFMVCTDLDVGMILTSEAFNR